MLETMYDAPGVGLAAIQIGVPLRMVTMDVSKSEDERQPMVLINPEIVWASEEKRTYEEGCLSIPEYYEEVERPDRVRFRYMNLAGRDRRAGGGRAARHLRAARDRPPERRPLHRLPVEAQARPGDDQVQEGGQARGAGHEPARRLHGHAGFRRARPSPRSSARATRWSPSTPARRPPPGAAWS